VGLSTILVADDSKVVQRVAERLLAAGGYQVALASDGTEALAWLASGRPDLIISDVNMPGRSSYEICRYVRAHPTLSTIPLLLISGFVDTEATRQAEACGANEILKKPLNETLLRKWVAELLTRPSAPPDASAGPPGCPSAVPDPRGSIAELTAAQAADGALQAFQRTIANVKRPEEALAEKRAERDRLTQQLAAARQNSERLQGLESRLAQEQVRSTDLARRLQEAERATAEARSRAETLSRTMAEIARLAGQP
jgi:CheY-like chemotaxis protein